MATSSEDMAKVTLAMNNVSVNVVEEEVEVKKKIDRHCAFCLTLVPGAEVKTCSKCKRRAYCSKECQVADWKLSKDGPAFNGKIHGYGQGHKNWCGLEFGEEDLDWKVVPISGKGLGLVALRDLPPLYRIIVEGMQGDPAPLQGTGYGSGPLGCYHPEINNMAPLSETDPSEKFHSNSQGTIFGPKVGLRNARVNHSCDANAFGCDEMEFMALILISNRAIKKGEEICYAYIPFNDVCNKIEKQYGGNSPAHFRELFELKWGFSCPPSCVCRDEEKFRMLEKCRTLFDECERDYRKKNCLKKMEKVIEIAGEIGCGASVMNSMHYHASVYARSWKETLKEGKKYLEMHLKANQAIYHPKNVKRVKDFEKALNDLIKVLEAEKK